MFGGTSSLGLRLAIAIPAVSFTVAGHILVVARPAANRGQFDNDFLLLLLADLLPPLILGLAVTRLRTVVVCGTILALLSTIPWAFYVIGNVVGAGQVVIFGFPVVLISCAGGAVFDLLQKSRQRSKEGRSPRTIGS